jgi:hypothetical protein
MNSKIPLLSLAATMSTGCLDELLKDTEETEETEETDSTGGDINGDWSLSDSNEACLEDSYTYDGVTYYYSGCYGISQFDMSIVDGAVASSTVVVDMAMESSDTNGGYDSDDYAFETEVTGISGSGTDYTLTIADGEVDLDCILSGSTLDCSADLDGESLEVTLTK